MNKWRIVYDLRQNSYMICFDTFHECMKWLRTNIESLRYRRVKMIFIDESIHGIWYRRHEHRFTRT